MELRQVERQHGGPTWRVRWQRLHWLKHRAGGGVAADLTRDVGVLGRPDREEPGQVTVRAVMQQRMHPGLIPQVAVPVPGCVEPGGGRTALPGALRQVVLERVHAGQHHIRRLHPVECRIELRQGTDHATVTVLQEVLQAPYAGRQPVMGAIPGRVEIGDGLPAFRPHHTRCSAAAARRRPPATSRLRCRYQAGSKYGFGKRPSRQP